MTLDVTLDHMIVPVNDRAASVRFLTDVVGLAREPDHEPFSVVRVNDGLTLQLAEFPTTGGMHLAFAMSRDDFDAAFARIKAAGLPYGDRFDSVGNMQGPGVTDGARGDAPSVYVHDPSQHLIELRCYD